MQIWQFLVAFSIPFPFLALRAEKNYRQIPRLTLSRSFIPDSLLPSLSIIIPARNEAENLTCLLPTLNAIQYNGSFEILVVDDNSTDRTAVIAQQLGAMTLSAGTLPPGWLGKPNACHQGAHAAQGDWLLFTDADTIHASDGPSLAVQYALAHQLDGLSLFLSESMFGITDRIAMMAAFAGLFAGMRRGQPLVNGQYILLRRDVYEKSGGFASVHHETLEDLAFAHSLAQQGFRVPILRGESAGVVRMYRDVGHLWHGLTRLGAGSLKWSGVGGWLTALFITGALMPVLALPALLVDTTPYSWVILTWLLVISFFLPWAVRAGTWRWAFLAPFGALFVQLAAVWGLLGKVFGKGVKWKGREVV